MISKIEIVFPVPVETPKGWEQKLSKLVDEICKKYKQNNPGRTMWTSGHGSKPIYIPLTQEDEKHRGMEFDDSVFQIEVAEREDYKRFDRR